MRAMPSLRAAARYWVPILVWMAVIFVGSGDMLAERNTSRFLLPFLRWLLPGLSEGILFDIHAAIRKTGHLAEYGILALLVLRALRSGAGSTGGDWSWRSAGLALAFCFAYAVSDEAHQFLVASRYGSAIDVLIDTAGAVIALLAAWLVHGLRRRLRPAPPAGPGAPAAGKTAAGKT